ncbi:MAG: hypothetical protein R3F59_17580 [Myxococcota bacterium]
MDPRTLELSTSRACAAPVGALWAAFTDVGRWVERIGVVEEVLHAPAAWRVGERVAFRLRVAGVVVPFDVRLEAVEPERLVRWSSVRWTVTGTRIWMFEADGPGSRVQDLKRFSHPVAPLRWVYPRAPILAMSEAWLQDLVRAAEAEAG